MISANVLWLMRAGALTALLAFAPHADAAQSGRHADLVAADLRQLAPFFDRAAGRLPGPLELHQPAACPTRLAYTALQYRREPDRFRNMFFALLVIDDYDERADGIYNMMSPPEAAAAINDATAEHPDVTDKRFQALLGFCAFQNENVWVDSPKGRISLARVMRGAALASLLAGTGEDPLLIAAAVDSYTAAGHDMENAGHKPPKETR